MHSLAGLCVLCQLLDYLLDNARNHLRSLLMNLMSERMHCLVIDSSVDVKSEQSLYDCLQRVLASSDAPLVPPVLSRLSNEHGLIASSGPSALDTFVLEARSFSQHDLVEDFFF